LIDMIKATHDPAPAGRLRENPLTGN